MHHSDESQKLRDDAIETVANLTQVRKDLARSIPSWANEYPIDIAIRMSNLDKAIEVISDLVVALDKAHGVTCPTPCDPDYKAKKRFIEHRDACMGWIDSTTTWESLSEGVRHYYRKLG